MSDKELKNQALNLIQTLSNAAGAEFEDQKMALACIKETLLNTRKPSIPTKEQIDTFVKSEGLRDTLLVGSRTKPIYLEKLIAKWALSQQGEGEKKEFKQDLPQCNDMECPLTLLGQSMTCNDCKFYLESIKPTQEKNETEEYPCGTCKYFPCPKNTNPNDIVSCGDYDPTQDQVKQESECVHPFEKVISCGGVHNCTLCGKILTHLTNKGNE